MSNENNDTGSNLSFLLIIFGVFLIFQSPVAGRAGNGPGGWLVRALSGIAILGAEFFLVCSIFKEYRPLWKFSVALMVCWVILLIIACVMHASRRDDDFSKLLRGEADQDE